MKVTLELELDCEGEKPSEIVVVEAVKKRLFDWFPMCFKVNDKKTTVCVKQIGIRLKN